MRHWRPSAKAKVHRLVERFFLDVAVKRPTGRFVDIEISRKLDLSCKGSLAEGEAHYFTGVMYQSSDLVVNRNWKERAPHSRNRM